MVGVGIIGTVLGAFVKAHPPSHPVWVLRPAIFFALFVNNSDIFETSPWVTAVVAFGTCTGVAIGVGWMLIRNRAGLGLWSFIGAGLLVGGASSNELSRVFLGGVPDFMGFRPLALIDPIGQRDHFPLYSTGDLAYFAGGAVLVFLLALSERRRQRS
jgi:lipoprotein signal peptidase